MAAKIRFTKMHGCGNDYIYVDTRKYHIPDPGKTAVLWSDRHTGIGSDELVLIGPSGIADCSMRIFNRLWTYTNMESRPVINERKSSKSQKSEIIFPQFNYLCSMSNVQKVSWLSVPGDIRHAFRPNGTLIPIEYLYLYLSTN